MVVVGIGITGAACQEDGAAAPRGYYQSAATVYNQPAPNDNYANLQGYQGGYNQARYM